MQSWGEIRLHKYERTAKKRPTNRLRISAANLIDYPEPLPQLLRCTLSIPFFIQLELDAEALERMDELTRQARKEQEKTTREKDRLQVIMLLFFRQEARSHNVG